MKWAPHLGTRISDEVIEQRIIEGYPDLCTHVRARAERLYAFFELPPDLSFPRPPPVRYIWEMPSLVVNPPASSSRQRYAAQGDHAYGYERGEYSYGTASYYQRAPGFR